MTETEVVYCDDNYERLGKLPPESVDLIYLDPPFFSNRHYEVIWGDEAEVRSFEDRWEGGIYHYVDWMRERVMEMWRVLKPTGSLYLHCDWHASHYLKMMLDDLGIGHFQNEIIWYYKGAGVSPKRWARRHDTILFYAKGKEWYFNPDPVRDEYADTTKERFSHYIGNVRGKHDYGQQALNPKGKHPDDVWQIKIVAPSARDRLGYPTQKPEELLQRIILASSKEGDVVLDPFAGCGTTLVVAQRLKRHWVGIDISSTACDLISRRLERIGCANVKMVGMPTTVEDMKALKPHEFANRIVGRINGIQSPRKSGDMGIDGWTFMVHEPIQIKQSEHIGTRGAHEEVARIKREGLEIHLIGVADLLAKPDEVLALMGSVAGLKGISEMPLPKFEPGRYSAEELVHSDTQS